MKYRPLGWAAQDVCLCLLLTSHNNFGVKVDKGQEHTNEKVGISIQEERNPAEPFSQWRLYFSLNLCQCLSWNTVPKFVWFQHLCWRWEVLSLFGWKAKKDIFLQGKSCPISRWSRLLSPAVRVHSWAEHQPPWSFTEDQQSRSADWQRGQRLIKPCYQDKCPLNSVEYMASLSRTRPCFLMRRTRLGVFSKTLYSICQNVELLFNMF